MTEGRRWGKAGVRLTPAEAAARDSRTRRERNIAKAGRAAELEVARRKWAAGLLVPHRITTALDSHGLDGPDVDRQCKTAEPGVDLWELGQLYPTWEQFLALCDLTRMTPTWFFNTDPPLAITETSLVCRMSAAERRAWDNAPPPVNRFDDDAIRNAWVFGVDPHRNPYPTERK